MIEHYLLFLKQASASSSRPRVFWISAWLP
jgi:hypothetical protein